MKESEFERYDRMKRLEREAEKKKSSDGMKPKKKGGKPKQVEYAGKNVSYMDMAEQDDFE